MNTIRTASNQILNSICVRPNPNRIEMNRVETVFAIIMDIKGQRMWVNPNRPDLGEFEELRLLGSESSRASL